LFKLLKKLAARCTALDELSVWRLAQEEKDNAVLEELLQNGIATYHHC